MGVSTDNTDIAMLVEGGAGFAQRLAELSAAKDGFDKALQDLNLGKAAVAAHDEAGRVLAEAKAKRDADLAALDAEVANARSGVALWVEQTKAEAAATLTQARDALADAKAQQDIANAARDAAQKALTEAKATAEALVKDAQAAADAKIAKANAAADDILARANETDKKARQALAEAEASKAKYDATMDKIKSVASNIT